jgi:hypothetical protein
MGKQTITIKTSEENPESVELIADSIIKISDAFEKMKSSKLTERAVHLLIKDAIGGSVGIPAIKQVLDASANLKKYYIKELPKKNNGK